MECNTSSEHQSGSVCVIIYMSARTDKNIATLQPKAQVAARAFMDELNKHLPEGYTAEIISGNRTYDEQRALFAQGRTAPGHRVTNANAGYSNHNFGIAWDIGFFKGGKYLDEDPMYKVAGKIGEQQGLDWGGDWHSIVDEPHFQLKTEYSLADLRQLHDAGHLDSTFA